MLILTEFLDDLNQLWSCLSVNRAKQRIITELETVAEQAESVKHGCDVSCLCMDVGESLHIDWKQLRLHLRAALFWHSLEESAADVHHVVPYAVHFRDDIFELLNFFFVLLFFDGLELIKLLLFVYCDLLKYEETHVE